jgi:3-deoxy-manno-octulosonate cytidylyltransferase (CMP-KDO synthetase)
MGSTRFPGKPLVDLCGKPMVHWVVDAARESSVSAHVVVATPDSEIVDYCRHHNIEVMPTLATHPSGTDRLAEVARTLEADVYLNVQGDEPLIPPATILACARPLLDDPEVKMTSVWSPCPPDEEHNPAVVKVVTDLDGNALYFSRHPIPFPRNERTCLKKHIGIYGFRRDVLSAFAAWPPTVLEQTESLEQLRFLEHGIKIRMAEGVGSAMAVDTPEQAEIVRRILLGRNAAEFSEVGGDRT